MEMVIGLITLAVIVVIVGYVAWGAYKVLVVDAGRYATYWRKRADEPVPKNAIRLLALGDSTFQAVGASRAERGTVGLAVTYLEQQTGRPVHVTNLSVSGAKARGVAGNQLPHADFAAADIVMIALGANDAMKQSDESVFGDAIEKIAGAAPPEKTVMADVALVKNRGPYQRMLHAARERRGIKQADLQRAFSDIERPWALAARDFFHPSDWGYQFWFAGFRPAIDELITSRKHR